MFDNEMLSFLMTEKNMTNKMIAEKITSMGINISESSFKGYRQGKFNPRMKILSAIAIVLEVEEQQLIKK